MQLSVRPPAMARVSMFPLRLNEYECNTDVTECRIPVVERILPCIQHRRSLTLLLVKQTRVSSASMTELLDDSSGVIIAAVSWSWLARSSATGA
jgi:hypothetical protein